MHLICSEREFLHFICRVVIIFGELLRLLIVTIKIFAFVMEEHYMSRYMYRVSLDYVTTFP